MNYFLCYDNLLCISMQLEQTLVFKRLERSERLQNRVVIEVLAPSKFGNPFKPTIPKEPIAIIFRLKALLLSYLICSQRTCFTYL